MTAMTTPQTATAPALIAAERVSKTFPLPQDHGGVFTVLDEVSCAVAPGEVVALLGRSGSGKSTLLRIMAGLIPASGGRVLSRGAPLHGPNPDVAMVFQSFALLPWLTVQDNVELGLKARGVPREERRKRALAAIDMVGLDGFESAYPKELSGGMQQRVGFARAFVVRPRVLMMDEPCSALDVLTAENLRGEISDLWQAGDFPARSILLVTHNIEEAVLLADRVLVLGSNPGRIRGEVQIDLVRPRDREQPRFKSLVAHIYTVMTHPEADVTPVLAEDNAEAERFRPLPHARAGGISGLLELVVDQGGMVDIPRLAQRLRLDVDDLLPILDAAVLLGFAKTVEGHVTLTDDGRAFAEADILRSKDLFRQQVLAHAPLVAAIADTLRQKRDGTMRAGFFLDLLDEHYPPAEAERQFATAVDWGRYGELFEYDAGQERLRLPDPEPAGAS
ncbi:MAG TPA: nitrate/sulfonate/bicarbonate ABC transporter ATP-binding protein [Dehalococcoidia bacterium]|nr:nitrate/sulfonate/bicarbonate ABC transporter ATP-binding protein [Dehalococcoidia bacterium]